MTKLNQHPACGCTACRRLAGGAGGQVLHKLVNRAIRHRAKQTLAQAMRTAGELDAVQPVVVSTYYVA